MVHDSGERTATEVKAREDDHRRVSLVGAAYVLLAIVLAQVSHVGPLSEFLASATYADHPVIGSLVLGFVPSVGFSLLVWALVRSRREAGPLFDSLRIKSLGKLLAVFVFVAILHIQMANRNFWPWYWMEPSGETVRSYVALASSPFAIHPVIAFIRGAIIVPVNEELIFRFGFFGLLRRKLSSNIAAMLGVSALFGVLHSGNMLAITSFDLYNLTMAGVMSLVNCVLVLRFRQGLLYAIAVHASRNLLETGIALHSAYGVL